MLNKWKTKCKGKKGFTLIELIVVIAIIAILIALLVPSIMKFINSAKITAANANAKMVFVAAQTYLTEEYTKNGTIPTEAQTNAALGDYISGSAKKGTFSVTVSNGVAQSATWKEEGGTIEGKYPGAGASAPTT